VNKIVKKTAIGGIKLSQRIITKSPRLKRLASKVFAQVILTSKKDPYVLFLNKNFPDFIEISKLKEELDQLTYQPLISVLVPTYDTDHTFLRNCIESVRAQIYQNWELCIVDDASPDETVRTIIKEYADLDSRIKYTFLKKNHHIAGATNEALALAKGEYIGLFDHDDLLWPNALLEIAKAVNGDKKIDFLYTDEDKISESMHDHFSPVFKPDWNPDYLYSVNYITHFAVVKKTILDKVGGFKEGYNGAQDWDLFLRITGITKHIHHIPKILYSWRVHDLSTAKSTDSKPYVVEAQYNALHDDLIRRGRPDAIVERDPKHSGYWKVTFPLIHKPLISIVIPTKNQYKVVKRCIDSIISKTTYDKYEIILVDTGSSDPKVLVWYKVLTAEHKNIHIVDWPEQPFSYARSCNEGARKAKGEILVMLNNDTEVITPEWLELLGGDAQRPEIAAVGCLLFFPDRHHIQHAGVGVGLGGVAANSFSMMTLQHAMSQTQHLMINTKHDMTAVTAACLAIRKSVFDEVGGFDEEFRITYNDVDLCLRLYEKGYQNIYTPHVRLVHHESISVGLPDEIAKRDTGEFDAAKELFVKRWKKYVKHDPNINPNLSKQDALYEIPSIT
jgi:glycosyltransferase involved in cell wall biosynthesis